VGHSIHCGCHLFAALGDFSRPCGDGGDIPRGLFHQGLDLSQGGNGLLSQISPFHDVGYLADL
jgi:hypothetical protein